MEIVVIDGQGGGIGKNIIQVLKEGEGFLLSPFLLIRYLKMGRWSLQKLFFEKYINNVIKICKFMFIFALSNKMNEKYDVF